MQLVPPMAAVGRNQNRQKDIQFRNFLQKNKEGTDKESINTWLIEMERAKRKGSDPAALKPRTTT
jgi:hypothetical protein